MSRIRDLVTSLRRTPRFSARGFLLYAALFLALYVLCHALGMRRYTSVVCGNPAAACGSQYLGTALACLYILLYLGAVVCAPILVIGAAVLGLLPHLVTAKQRDSSGKPAEPGGPAGV